MKDGGGWRGTRGTRHERGYGSAWDKLRAAVMSRDLGECQPCKRAGRDRPAREADHIVPKAQGGTDDLGNLQAICRQCHAEKSSAEGAQAQGRRARPRIGADGWPLP